MMNYLSSLHMTLLLCSNATGGRGASRPASQLFSMNGSDCATVIISV